MEKQFPGLEGVTVLRPPSGDAKPSWPKWLKRSRFCGVLAVQVQPWKSTK